MKVAKGYADFTVGGFILSEKRFKYFKPSDPYLEASIGFCFKEVNAYTSFTRLTAPLKLCLWILIGCILISSSAIILSSKKLSRKWRHFIIGGRMNRTPILNMWNSVLGNSIANKHIAHGKNFGNFARILIFFWIILWFVLRNTYQGSLYTHLQSNRVSSPYDTIEKVIESDCKIVIPPTVDSFILKDVKDQERYAKNESNSQVH